MLKIKILPALNSRIASTEKAIPGARAAVQEAEMTKVKEAEANPKDDFVTCITLPHMNIGSGWQDQGSDLSLIRMC
ncbi:hypothetical protein [Klebsiella pneumoniae]